MQPAPWSPSSLAELKDCPKQFHETRVLKRFAQTRNEYNTWGDYVHTAFEKRLDSDSVPLPHDLKVHEAYLRKIDEKPGFYFVEQRAAFNKRAEPVSWEWRKDDLWSRFKIDYSKVDLDGETKRANVYDWKTGKQKDNFRQLSIYALYVFASHPVDIVDARFYWTQTQTETRRVWSRAEVPALWGELIPDLREYAETFKKELWTPRQGWKCKGYCPVTDCPFWEAPRKRN